jgi:membrane-associated phospholipid phosphatase
MFQRISARVKKFLAGVALLSVEMAIVVSLFICALVIFIFVARRIFVLHSTAFDQRVFTYLKQHVSERNNDVVMFFTFLGSHEFLIPANLVLIGYFLLIRKHKWHSIKIPAIAISSLLLMFVLKRLFNRPRPDIPLLYEAKGLSFPSGHALMSVTFYGLLIYIVFKTYRDKDWKWIIISLLILLILIIGFTRIYLRVHYTSDVIAGYCIGFLWLVFAVWFLNRLEKYSKKKLDAVVKQEPVPAEASVNE